MMGLLGVAGRIFGQVLSIEKKDDSTAKWNAVSKRSWTITAGTSPATFFHRNEVREDERRFQMMPSRSDPVCRVSERGRGLIKLQDNNDDDDDDDDPTTCSVEIATIRRNLLKVLGRDHRIYKSTRRSVSF